MADDIGPRIVAAIDQSFGVKPGFRAASNSSTDPKAADYSLETSGMAVKLLLVGGRESDVVAYSVSIERRFSSR